MRRLQIKFPSQIRISGWDFGSSARAMNQAGGKDSLMTYESVSTTQAEPTKYVGSTFERKIMSSTIKRVALVAVAALGLGSLSVISAQAAVARTATGAATATVQAATATQALGTVTLSSNLLFAGSDTIGVTSLTGPAGGTVTVATIGGSTIVTTSSANVATVGSTATFTASVADSTSGAFVGQVSLPGTYVMTLAGGATLTITATGQKNSIVPLVGDGFSKTAANSTNGSTLSGVAGAFNTVTVGVVSGTGVAVAGGNTWGTSGARTMVSVSGAGATISGSTNATISTDKLSAVTSTSNMTFASNPGALVINTPTVGTITVSSYLETGNGTGIFSQTADKTITITVNATASTGVEAAAASSSVIKSGATWAAGTSATTDDVVRVSGVTASTTTASAVVKVDIADAGLNALTKTVGVVVSGPGTIKLATSDSGNSTGERVASLSNGGGSLYVRVFADGTAGVTTLTITAGTLTYTETITWLGAAKTLTATAVQPHIVVGTVADAIEIVAKDANGEVTTFTPSALSSATSYVSSTLSNCAVATDAEVLLGYTKGAYYCDVTGVAVGSATLTIAPSSTTTNSPTVTFKVTKSVAASVALSTDKETYLPGEKIKLIITAKDADGNLLGAGTYDLLGAASTVNTSLTGTAFTDAAFAISAGEASTTYYAPLVAGSVTFSAKLSTDAAVALGIQATTITTTASVSDNSAAVDAANEATDAANAATDAANAAAEAADAATAAAQDAQAAVAALATSVASLIAGIKAQITTLTNLVIKIQKKVRA